jgi:hypothetical protein
MSRILSDLLGAKEPLFTQTLQELESASNSSGIDINLATEIDQKGQAKIRELGLDPSDTSSKELYHALQGLTARHDMFLSQIMGVDDPMNVEEVLSKVTNMINRLPLTRTAWVLKHAAARKLLKEMPPKKVMKQLGYRSVDSMLKRENIAELFGALRFIETSDWLHKFIRSYKKLRPQDFESRDVEVVTLSQERWEMLTRTFVNSKRRNVTHLKELGVVVIMPMPLKQMKGVGLAVLMMVMHYLDEIRAYSAYFKLAQVRSDFSAILIKTLIYDPKNTVTMIGQPIHWRVLRRHFGSAASRRHPEIFEPHVQPEDLRGQRAPEVLYRLEPALKFWEDMDWVGVLEDNSRPVSFNLMDNAISYCNGLKFGEQSIYSLQTSLWNELLARYMCHEKLEASVLKQLDDNEALLTISEGDL